MPENRNETAERIQAAALAISRRRPSYRPLLEFYATVFQIQEACTDRLRIPVPEPFEQRLSAKAAGGLALVSIAAFPVDEEGSKALLVHLCRAVASTETAVSGAAGKLLDGIGQGRFEPSALFHALIEERGEVFEETSRTLGVDPEMLAFFAYHSILPGVRRYAADLAKWLDPETASDPGPCPVCGTEPGLAVLDAEGRKGLFCAFCWHRWPVKRTGCPFCGTTDARAAHYFCSEEEGEYRVDLCENCKRYTKTVDLRRMDRFFYPLLEAVATLHLDMIASEKGFSGPLPRFLSA